MLSSQIRILNFDDSLTTQKKLLEKFQPKIIDLKKIGPYCRLWSDTKIANKIKELLTPGLKNSITFLGSGDFHHISGILIEQFQEPINVIVFDYHPDWDILPPRLGCGSWVTNTLKKPNVIKMVLLGVSSEDISNFWVQTGNLNSLQSNRVEIYPYAHKPTLTLLKSVPDNVSISVDRGLGWNKIRWQELKNKDLTGFFYALLDRLKTKKVYLSIDKDCLKPAYSMTNWEEGCFELNELLTSLKLIRDNLDVIGMDITGEYSIPEVKGKIKTFFSRLDHPRDYSAKNKPDSYISSINEQTNIKILELFLQE